MGPMSTSGTTFDSCFFGVLINGLPEPWVKAMSFVAIPMRRCRKECDPHLEGVMASG